MRKLTTEQWIQKAILVYGYKYDYSLVDYITAKIKIIIICPIHGKFLQSPDKHLQGRGCSECGRILLHNYFVLPLEEFINRSNLKHNFYYDYSEAKYESHDIPVIIICPIHGRFTQKPRHHMEGSGCTKCYIINLSFPLLEVIERCKVIHQDLYTYNVNQNYNNYESKLEIECIDHGIFYQEAKRHILGQGCPRCATSKGENKIRKWLIENGIVFEEQKKYKECINIRCLPFDFYITHMNLLIEYDEIFHYKIVNKSKDPQKILKNSYIHK